ncbi:hypothetical protein BDC45DRAFT_564297 [Circinella umbellata]|nr:hypothetical protein BDC45DRAFT_564297 [Circinella umbellata]
MEKCFEDILNVPTDYYRILNVSTNSSIQDIRHAYLKKSRYCHPDRFVPANPRATECFQLLNKAYNTLSNETLRFEYDCARNFSDHDIYDNYGTSGYEYKGDMFERMVYQACEEMMEGQFHALKVLFYTFRGTENCTCVDDRIIDSIEYFLKNMYYILTQTQNCYHVVKQDIIELYQLQKKLRNLSIFDVGSRLRLSLTISKIMLKLILKSTTLSIQEHNQEKDSYGFEKTLQSFIEMIETIECKF